MSNFLKKGVRDNKTRQKKNTKQIIKDFQKTLLAMNHAYTELLRDPTVTEDNFDEKLQATSEFKFSEKQVGMLRRDILTPEPEISPESESNPE